MEEVGSNTMERQPSVASKKAESGQGGWNSPPSNSQVSVSLVPVIYHTVPPKAVIPTVSQGIPAIEYKEYPLAPEGTSKGYVSPFATLDAKGVWSSANDTQRQPALSLATNVTG